MGEQELYLKGDGTWSSPCWPERIMEITIPTTAWAENSWYSTDYLTNPTHAKYVAIISSPIAPYYNIRIHEAPNESHVNLNLLRDYYSSNSRSLVFYSNGSLTNYYYVSPSSDITVYIQATPYEDMCEGPFKHMPVLWQNADLTSNFAAQTITLSESVNNYHFWLIECSVDKSGNVDNLCT